jgi:hypothetical protein
MFMSFDTSGRIAQLDGNGTFITRMVRGPQGVFAIDLPQQEP